MALLAAVGAGEFKNVAEACEATVKTVEETKPITNVRRYYEKAVPVHQDLYGTLSDEFKRIAELN